MPTIPKRHFIGWDRPVLHATADWLAGETSYGLLDLSGWLVVVPTRHAGRRLREHLAQLAGNEGGGVVPPTVVTPQSLIAIGNEGVSMADRQLLLAVWVEVLRALPKGACPRLFPGPRERRDIPWALASAQRFLQVQHLLGERGLTIRALAREDVHSKLLEEPERWEELAKIEASVAEVLDSMGMAEPTPARAAAAKHLTPPTGVTQVAVLGVPDPIPLTLIALEALQRHVPVHVVIHAPESKAKAFDLWGRPNSDYWSHHPLPLDESSIQLVGGPDDMGPAVLETLSAVGVASADVVVGVPDGKVVPYLNKVLGSAGLATHDPAGLPLRNHPLVTLLEQVARLRESGSFASLATLFRHPDYLRLLRREVGALSVKTLLTELDAFQNEYLPSRVADVTRHLARNPRAGDDTLRRAMGALAEHLGALGEGPLGKSLLQFFARVYATRQLHLERPEDRAFQAAARAISDLLYRLDLPVYDLLSLTPSDRFSLLRQTLSGLSYYLDRDPEAVDLLGWLELHWDDAPWIVITGMNDGKVPEAVVGDAFLPDSLRQSLGIACNASRFGRDAYLAQAMIACRQSDGAGSGVKMVVGRVSDSGDPLRPSRLLFLCNDEALAPRVEKLFHELPPPRSAPVTPRRWLALPPPGSLPRHLSATALREYLDCPFRFYLNRVLGMEQVDDRARELNPMQFGILCHEALEALGRSKELADSSNEADLAAFLDSAVTRRVSQWFGRSVPVAVQVQIDSARQRLRWAARIEARERSRGWRIVSVESDLGTRTTDTLGQFLLRGRIDRLDRHENGAYRVLDYKTREQSKSPADSHLRRARPDTAEWQRVEINDKAYEWVDLQLPLYAHFVGKSLQSQVKAGIFELPGAVSQTDITIFEELTPHLVECALKCATAAANAIADWQFWPPRKVKYDDFKGLLGANPEAGIEVDAFLAMLARRRREES